MFSLFRLMSGNRDHAARRNRPDEEIYREDPNEENPGMQVPLAGPDNNHEDLMGRLTQRLRCSFALFTWPIIPLLSIVLLSLGWFLYSGLIVDRAHKCSHPIRGYVYTTLFFILSMPLYVRFRRYLRQHHDRNSNNNGGRPRIVQRFDQLIQTVALLYVYGGITLVQTCQADMDEAMENPTSTCQATCPSLYSSLSIYVGALEFFTFSLILPLLCLPCLYVWFLRQATADAETLAALQEHLQDEHAWTRNGNVSAEEILSYLDEVKLRVGPENQTFVVPLQQHDVELGQVETDSRECCICMEAFKVESGEAGRDVEEGQGEATSELDRVVQTRNCGHLFHRRCMSSWVGGQWHSGGNARRRARRTTCPLCRRDLRGNDAP